MAVRRRTGRVLASFAVVVGSAVAAAPQQPTVEEIVARNIEARGGAERLGALTSSKITGMVDAQGQKLQVTLTARRPNLLCHDVDVQGTTIRSVFDGKQAWTVNPMLGSSDPQPLEGFPAEALRDQSAFDGLLAGYEQRGDTIALEGTEEVEGAPAYKLKLTHPSGRVMHVFVDVGSGLEKKLSASYDQDGQPIVVETLLGDYKAVDGVQVPHSQQTTIAGQPQGVFRVTSVEFNVPVDEAMFAMAKGR